MQAINNAKEAGVGIKAAKKRLTTLEMNEKTKYCIYNLSQYLCLSLYLHLRFCLYICLSVCLFTCVCFSVYLSLHLYLSIYVSLLASLIVFFLNRVELEEALALRDKDRLRQAIDAAKQGGLEIGDAKEVRVLFAPLE